MIPQLFSVRQIKQETHDTFTLELEPKDGKMSSFEAGQFNMLYVFGVGEVPISISGSPGATKTLMHTTREVGTVTKAMRNLKRGDVIGVRGPFGTHWPVEEAAGSDIVIVAGGIGLAPLKPALSYFVEHRQDYGRVVLLYGTRSPNDILFEKELKQWRADFDLEIYVTVDRAIGTWRGNVGVVTTLIPKAPFDPLSSVALICGPEIMMRYTVQELLRRGVSPDKVHVSMERNMKCGLGFCGHCQMESVFVCKEGPVFRYSEIESMFGRREI